MRKGDFIDQHIDMTRAVRGMETRAEPYYGDSYLGHDAAAVNITPHSPWSSVGTVRYCADRVVLRGSCFASSPFNNPNVGIIPTLFLPAVDTMLSLPRLSGTTYPFLRVLISAATGEITLPDLTNSEQFHWAHASYIGAVSP